MDFHELDELIRTKRGWFKPPTIKVVDRKSNVHQIELNFASEVQEALEKKGRESNKEVIELLKEYDHFEDRVVLGSFQTEGG